MTYQRHKPWMVRSGGAMHVSLWIALYLLAGTEPVFADPSVSDAKVTEAERYADQAFQAYESKHYVEAVTLYLKAYASAPSAAILYNIARIYDVGLRDRPLAINFYRQYVSDPGAEPKYITSANERLLSLRAAEDAAASFNGEGNFGTTAPPPMAASSAKPSAAPSIRSSAPEISAGAGSLQEREPTSASPSSGSTSVRTAAVITAVAGVVGIGIGTGFGIAAMSKASKASDQCAGNRCSSQAGVDAANAATHNATVSTIGFAVGGACVVTSVLLWWLSGSGTAPEEPRASVHVVPVASHHFVGALMHGEL